ncbi:RNA-guided endonuclease InsQ/TnpB family protein [Trichothermofontia sp.]
MTIVFRLQPTPEQAQKIEATLSAFANACNFINANVNPKLVNNVRVQILIYHQVKSQFDLSANLTIRAIASVCANRKTAKLKNKPVKDFRPTSADYDTRIFAFREKDWSASLSLVGGREHIKMVVGNYQMGKLKGEKPTSATLCQHRDGRYYIQVKDTVPEPNSSDAVIGVDLGRRDIAVTSNGNKWDGKGIQAVRDRFAKVRASLQHKASKGTRSSRRRCRQVLKRLSGRGRKYQSWLNHNIGRTIVHQAKSEGKVITIEDSSGIRERTNQMPRSKTERRRSNSWAFYQLRQFLEYKAIGAGVTIVPVPPAYTLQTCHKCLHIHPDAAKSYRNGKRFKCGHCGWEGDADFNGASVIALLGLTVNQPSPPLSPRLRGDVGGGGWLANYRATKSPRIYAWGSLRLITHRGSHCSCIALPLPITNRSSSILHSIPSSIPNDDCTHS